MCVNFYYYCYYLFVKSKCAFGLQLFTPSLHLVCEKMGPTAIGFNHYIRCVLLFWGPIALLMDHQAQ